MEQVLDVKNVWQLQEAKDQLSLVVENAMTKGAQTITRHGKPAVVVLSIEEFNRDRKPKESLVEFLRKSPLKYLKDPLPRDRDLPRDIEL